MGIAWQKIYGCKVMCISWEVNKIYPKKKFSKMYENLEKAAVSYIKGECLETWIDVIVVKQPL